MIAPWLNALAALLSAAPWSLSFEDPKGDDHGPGTYVYPSSSEVRGGDFDLRRVKLGFDGEDLVVEVSFGASIRRPQMVRKTHAAEIALDNEIYLQNVDLYFDTEPGAGLTDALPGRRVRFAPEDAWDLAVVITPRPARVRAALEEVLGKDARRVLVATAVRARGPTVIARVPAPELASASFGLSVLVTGAVWDESFEAVDRLAGQRRPSAFALPVLAISEDEAFGGGELGGVQPHVIDLLDPPGRDQRAILGAYDDAADLFAAVPTIRVGATPAPAPAPAAPAPQTPAERGPEPLILTVAEVARATIVIPDPNAALAPWQIGEVLSPDGEVVGRIVITAIHPGFGLATGIEGAVEAGARVRFTPPKRKKE